MHELYDTAANEGLGVRVAHCDEHVPADRDASAPFREYGRVVLKAADPDKQRRRGGNISSEIETGGGEVLGQHAVVFRKECELMGGKLLSEDRGRSKTGAILQGMQRSSAAGEKFAYLVSSGTTAPKFHRICMSM